MAGHGQRWPAGSGGGGARQLRGGRRPADPSAGVAAEPRARSWARPLGSADSQGTCRPLGSNRGADAVARAWQTAGKPRGWSMAGENFYNS